MDSTKLPVGFGMALAMNTAAMKVFAAMPERKQQDVIERAHGVSSKREMQQLVSSLTEKPKPMGER